MLFSVLDLAPIPEGSDAAQAIANSVSLARQAEALGFHRFWLAEHHNMPGIASAATSVLIGHVAAATSRIRVGAGGIMLPNHAPLAIAEQFGTLATIYPNRIDLGLGRAPGGDLPVMRALRRGLSQADTFPNDVVELISYLGPGSDETGVNAIPGRDTQVPVWILGSSLYGAQLAAHLGLPYAFASHFAPDALEAATATYRTRFRPSVHLDAPYFMLAVNIFAADTDDEAAYLRTSVQQAFARLRNGRPGKLPHPVEDIDAEIGARTRIGVDHALRISASGSFDTVRRQLMELIQAYTPNELILTAQIYDPVKRRRSFQIAADAIEDINVNAAA